jgi:Activator of Hsp90 ATPase homolog 1-like protein
MEQKTKIDAEDGKQDLMITREFDVPLELLFKAYADPKIVEQWMGTKVLKLENRKHGSWQFETSDDQGNVVFRANGVTQHASGIQIGRRPRQNAAVTLCSRHKYGSQPITRDRKQIKITIP